MDIVVKTQSIAELVVEKSRFIALVCPLDETHDVASYLNEAKKTYKDARHYTYAFRFGNLEKASDDGEPQNTAGLPLLNLLNHYRLVDTLLIVVRYFGGKKLGAGRLLRTYIEAGKSVLNNARFYQKVPAYNYRISTPISEYDRTRYQLEKLDYTILSTDFDSLDVTIVLIVSKEDAIRFETRYNVIGKTDAYILVEVENE